MTADSSVARSVIRLLVTGALLLATAPRVAVAQAERPTGLEARGLPVTGWDPDEGFGAGALLEVYQYGAAGHEPYEWTLQPTVFLTTEGRVDVTVFFDAPRLLPDGWRLDVFLGRQKQIATPFYGLGNATTHDEAREAEDGPDPYYYRFGRTRWSSTFTLQHRLGGTPLRFLFGGGIASTTTDPTPKDRGTTLYAQTYGADERTEWSNYVRGGLVWDTRDRESGTTRGSWSEVLVQWVDEGLGASLGFHRWTLADRRYVTLARGLVVAHRVLLQGVSEGAPVDELFRVQTSFKQQEGLGGSRTVRGLLRNRYVGRGLWVWNAELRWRAVELRLLGFDVHGVLVAFLDQGRVWEGSVRADQILTDLHRGWGGGARLGVGESFVTGFDVGTSAQTGLQLYLGVSYLY